MVKIKLWSSALEISVHGPLYIPGFVDDYIDVDDLIDEVPWEQQTSARRECFMTDPPGRSYTYGSGSGVRTYTSVAMIPIVKTVMEELNSFFGSSYNVCFLNLYDGQHNSLGWHADDFVGMDQEHPIASVSFGHEREIWWRPNGQAGAVPQDQRQLLGHGSVFVMPGGFQRTHQHRIPKGDRPMGPRVSLTYRRFT